MTVRDDTHPSRGARPDNPLPQGRIIALCGGVGGAKLALGLARLLPPEQLAVVVNTGDDFDHMGLRVCPDLDTVMYTLAGQSNPVQGWGLADESWRLMERLVALGGADWFQLGDLDLATHILRTAWLREGLTLTQVTQRLALALAIGATLLPMSDDPVSTVVHTADGRSLPFQQYFVRERCEPVVSRLEFVGADVAQPHPRLLQLLAEEETAGVVICPSNPYLSIDPLLQLPGLRSALQQSGVPVVAVAPIVAGGAIKGPTGKIMTELGVPVTPHAVARHYDGLLDGFLLDRQDAEQADAIAALGIRVVIEQTVMQTLADRMALAAAALGLIQELQVTHGRNRV